MPPSGNLLRLAVFDDDGTIYDSLATLVYPSVRATFELLNLVPPTLDVFREEGEPDVALFHYAHGVPKTVTADHMEIVRQLYYSARRERAHYRPGIEALLAFCRERELRVASCSAARHDNLMSRMTVAGIAEHFDIIQGSVRPRKVDALKAIADELAVPIRNAAMIGDTVWDIEDGREAGMRTIAFAHPTSYNSERRLRKSNPDYVVGSMRELRVILDRLSR